MSPARLGYTCLLTGLLPAVFAWLAYRGLKDPGYARGWAERLGLGPSLAAGTRRVWLHAASVGEVVAAAPLLRRLLAEPDPPEVVVTTMTPTGARRLRSLFGERVAHRYVPLDTPGSVRRFLTRIRPGLAVIMETELWPNLYGACARRGIPVVVANARMSARSWRRYRIFRGLAAETLSRLSLVAAQSDDDAERFRSLGLPGERLRVTGNLKFDLDTDASLRDAALVRRARWGERPVWVAASTHEGEDEQVLDAHQRLRERFPGALLVLVPRHPERFEAVAALPARHGLVAVRRSRGQEPGPETAVFVGDTMGELMDFYAAADVAFVGGSLVPVGGHNPLEPASLGIPVLTGPHVFNFAEVTAALEEARAARRVGDVPGLADALMTLLGDAGARRLMGEAGRDLIEANRGAVDRLWDLLAPMFPGPGGGTPATAASA